MIYIIAGISLYVLTVLFTLALVGINEVEDEEELS